MRTLSALSLLVACAACAPPAEKPAPGPRPTAPTTSAAAPSAAAPATTPEVIAEASLTGGAPSALGSPVVTTATELAAVKWAQDGGGEETLAPAERSTFVVVSFPEAAKVTYASTEVSLQVDGRTLSPVAVTSPSANPIQPRSADPGPAKYQRDVYMFVDWEPGPNTPFAIAFEVPAGTTSGTLRIAGTEHPLAW